MLIGSIIAGWIVIAVGMGIWAIRSATDPPMVECFDCDLSTCTGCPYLEKARIMVEDIYAGESKLAA